MKTIYKIESVILKYSFALLLLLLTASCSDDAVETGIVEKPAIPQSELRDGITVISDDSLGFMLFAPGKEDIHLIGDFNDWTVSDKYKMTKGANDRFFIRIGELSKDKQYVCQYLIDYKLSVADPYATTIADPKNDQYIPTTTYPNMPVYSATKTENIAMVVSTNKPTYSWSVADYKVSNPDNLVIYELLIRDFTAEGTIKAVEAKLPYLKGLGVNAIELMPFNEFEGNQSWGYNPSFYFATDKAYGTQADYKSFIDKCHANGMAVIMDMVLNHSYSQSPMVQMYKQGEDKISADNPWYNIKSNFEKEGMSWGYDFNHESIHTQQFVDSVCSFWMSEYKIDGFRFDFTKGFSNTAYPDVGDNDPITWGSPYDADRIRILKRMTTEIWKRKQDAVVIFEHLADNKEEKELAEHGIYLWGNINHNYNQMTMGYGDNNLNWSSYKERGWNSPKLVSYMESHDEERLMFKNLAYGKEHNGYSVKDLKTALQRSTAAAVLYFTIPGPKMVWQFGERGYDVELNGPNNEKRLEPKPPHWEYMDVAERKHMYDVYSKMIKLRTSNETFTTTDFALNAGEGFIKQVLLKSEAGKNVCAVANFDVVSQTAEVTFDQTGNWKEYFSGDALNVTAAKVAVTLKAGEYKLYIKQ